MNPTEEKVDIFIVLYKDGTDDTELEAVFFAEDLAYERVQELYAENNTDRVCTILRTWVEE